MITRLKLEPQNEMLRFGIGRNEGRWFFRIDLWRVGFRLTGRD